MKKHLLFALTALFAATLALGSCSPKQPDPPEKTPVEGETTLSYLSGEDLLSTEEGTIVKWEGRYEFKQGEGTSPSMVYLYHTATGFTVDFVGTSLTVDFFAELKNQVPFYNVAIDDELLPNPNEDRIFCLGEGITEVTVAEGLEYGVHTLTCLKMSEAYDATTCVINLETDGKFIRRNPSDDNGNYRFMMVCASGGSGFGSLAYSEGSSKISRTTYNSSSLHAFNYLTARAFDADVQYVATSGWGVKYPRSINAIMDYAGNTTENSVSSAQKTAKWDYDCWIPDVILFNIGGNDTTQSNFDRATYQKEVVAMVTSLHEHYPKAKMIWIHTGSNAGSYAMTAISDAGLSYVKAAIIPKVGAGETGNNTYGASNHNSLKSHIDGANILISMLEEMGYAKSAEQISFDDFEPMLQTTSRISLLERIAQGKNS